MTGQDRLLLILFRVSRWRTYLGRISCSVLFAGSCAGTPPSFSVQRKLAGLLTEEKRVSPLIDLLVFHIRWNSRWKTRPPLATGRQREALRIHHPNSTRTYSCAVSRKAIALLTCAEGGNRYHTTRHANCCTVCDRRSRRWTLGDHISYVANDDVELYAPQDVVKPIATFGSITGDSNPSEGMFGARIVQQNIVQMKCAPTWRRFRSDSLKVRCDKATNSPWARKTEGRLN